MIYLCIDNLKIMVIPAARLYHTIQNIGSYTPPPTTTTTGGENGRTFFFRDQIATKECSPDIKIEPGTVRIPGVRASDRATAPCNSPFNPIVLNTMAAIDDSRHLSRSLPSNTVVARCVVVSGSRKETLIAGNEISFLMIHVYSMWKSFIIKTAATWQNQQSDCAPREDSDQPGHPPSLIRVFAVRMRRAWVFSYPLSASKESD